ncbi:hypothetical protein [Mesorhizobium sp. 1M-11]|uniref:hypothetical protein n=1 Tax=Mesorhizobium sp. 1M-11 TaxID=1529006 RepID=UPI0006C73A7D|nr:hypothetical protein [Mesorhizobium sp. 1M-11]
MRLLLCMAAAMLALAGCTTVEIDQSIRRNLPQICKASADAHGLYLVAVAFGKVSERNQQRVDGAWNSLVPLCKDPSSQTTAGVLTAAFTAYLTISSYARE